MTLFVFATNHFQDGCRQSCQRFNRHSTMKTTFLLIIVQFFSLYISFPATGQLSLLDSIINHEEARRLVEQLASDSFQGRFTGSKGATGAAELIAREFEKAGTSPISGNEGYFMPFDIISDLAPYGVGYNVMAGKTGSGKKEEIIIFSAHYDHVGSSPAKRLRKDNGLGGNTKDNVYNGANDNASGVAAIILLARYFVALNQNEKTLLFISFSGEEIGLLGSKALAEIMDAKTIHAFINVEMIGRSRGQKAHPYVTGSSYSDLRTLLNESLQEQGKSTYDKNFFVSDPFGSLNLFSRSDNWPFAMKGIPAHSVMLSSPNDRYYHSADDEAMTLDFHAMTNVIKAIALSCTSLIKGTVTPKRIATQLLPPTESPGANQRDLQR
jgi:hypothetical protein